MHKLPLLIPALLLGLLISGCAERRGFAPVMGIDNLEVVDEVVLRGAQPNALALQNLKAVGVGLVINVRHDPWCDEAAVCQMLGIEYLWVPLPGASAPIKADIERVLTAISKAKGRVYIHCQFGCDRTGTAVACYKIRIHRASNAAALADAEFHGMSALEGGMKRFIRGFR